MEAITSHFSMDSIATTIKFIFHHFLVVELYYLEKNFSSQPARISSFLNDSQLGSAWLRKIQLGSALQIPAWLHHYQIHFCSQEKSGF